MNKLTKELKENFKENEKLEKDFLNNLRRLKYE